MSPSCETTGTAAAELPAALARWRRTVEAELKGATFEKKLVTRTFEGIALQPLYTRADVAGLHNIDTRPGEPPFLRGVRPHGYRTAPWEVAQEIAVDTARAFNAALLTGLAGGQNSVVLAPDGRGGPSVRSSTEYRRALADVDLGAVPVHVRTGSDPLPLAACHLALARERGVGWERLTGSIAGDPLANWAARGRLPGGLQAAFASIAGWTKWAGAHGLRLRTLHIDATLWANAGATAVQELGITLAALAEHLRHLERNDVPPSLAAERLVIRFAVGPQFFMEIAKFRALRPLCARVLGACGAPDAAAGRPAVHAATATWNKSLLDPHVNLLRATTEALSAVLGGCDALHVAPFDEVTGATNDFSRRIAGNVHTLLAEEFGFSQVADPGGGCWYVERLTDELARSAWLFFQQIEGRGGLAAALRTQYVQDMITQARGEKAEAVAKRRAVLIGTNLFPNLKEKPLVPAATSPLETAGPAASARVRLPAGASWPALLEAALAAAQGDCRLEELAAPLPSSGTDERRIVAVDPWRAASGFERLRVVARELGERRGVPPRVFLAKIGPVLQHKARAEFSSGFFAVGGFEVMSRQAFDTAAAAGTAARESGADIAVLCSTDDTYPLLVPEFVAAARAEHGKPILVLAGLPADPAQLAAFRKAGIDEFIHLRADVQQTLAKLLQNMGGVS